MTTTTAAVPPTTPPIIAPTLLPEETEGAGMAVVVELEPEAEALVELLYVLEEVVVKEGTGVDNVELGGSCVPVLTLL